MKAEDWETAIRVMMSKKYCIPDTEKVDMGEVVANNIRVTAGFDDK